MSSEYKDQEGEQEEAIMTATIDKILCQVACVKALLSKNRGLIRCVAKEKAEAKVFIQEDIYIKALQRKDLEDFN